MLVTRRSWLRAAGAALAAGLGSAREVRGDPRSQQLRVGVLAGRDAPASWRRGAQLGLEEARSTAALLGLDVVAVDPSAHASAGVSAPLEALRTEQVAAVVAWLRGNDLVEAEAWAGSAGVLLLDANVQRTSDARCLPSVFRLNVATHAVAAAGDAPPLLAWHHSLDRYGAEQLNQRFHARFGSGMDGAAWTSWLAVKVLVETALRARSTEPGALAAYLVRADAHFDGHKGRPLRFGPDHVLDQPLYVQGASGRVSEAEAPSVGGMSCAGDPR